MTEPNQELLPCPHCGGEAQSGTDDTIGRWGYVECTKCIAEMKACNEGEAITIWNYRAFSDDSLNGEVITQCRAMLEDQLRIKAAFFDDCVAQAIARVKIAEGKGWLSIESAPKDGSQILMTNRTQDMFIARYAGIKIDKWIYHDGDYTCYVYRPTHWQPLPAPPKSGGEG